MVPPRSWYQLIWVAILYLNSCEYKCNKKEVNKDNSNYYPITTGSSLLYIVMSEVIYIILRINCESHTNINV